MKSYHLFSKFSSSLAAHQETIALSPLAEKIDYEAEMVIVIGKKAKNVSEDDTLVLKDSIAKCLI